MASRIAFTALAVDRLVFVKICLGMPGQFTGSNFECNPIDIASRAASESTWCCVTPPMVVEEREWMVSPPLLPEVIVWMSVEGRPVLLVTGDFLKYL